MFINTLNLWWDGGIGTPLLNFIYGGKWQLFVRYKCKTFLISLLWWFCVRALFVPLNQSRVSNLSTVLDYLLSSYCRTERLTREFHFFDQDKDGRISLEDFQKALEQKGNSDDEVDQMVAKLNFDSGFLSPLKFRQFLNHSDSVH